MINRLHLRNFRRHTDTELEFGNQDQLVAICGVNGAGKTTLLESLLFAFYGETRNGRRGLDTLVTRGAELEGVEVACEFTVAGSGYRVQRRRVEGVSSALLFCDGQLLCEGPSAVDAEMVNVLGMDAAGFKLAVIAKQKELDGLTSLSKRERQRMLARLLRVDVVARAQAAAHDRYQRAAELVAAMGPAPDVDAMVAELAGMQERAAELDAAAATSREALAEADAQLGELDGTEAAFQAALALEARAQGALDAAQAALAAARDEISTHGDASEPAGTARDEADVLEDLRVAEADRSAARSAAEVHTAHAALVATHQEVVADIAARRERLVDVDVDAARTASEGAAARAAELAAARDTARDEFADLQTRLNLARQELETLEGLEGEPVCPTCSQPVTAEHLAEEVAAVRARIGSLTEDLEAKRTSGTAVSAELRTANDEAAAAAAALTEAVAAARTNDALAEELAELSRRRDSYELRLTRELPEMVELPPLDKRVAELEAELVASRELAAARRRWREHTTRAAELQRQADEAAAAVTTRTTELEAARPAAELVAAHDRLVALKAARAAEAELLSAVERDLAAARAEAEGHGRRVADARSFTERRAEHADRARVAAYTKSVLKAVHASLSTELRPNLEGTLCEVLTRLSEGRFTSARLDEDYEVTVLDDGAYRPLSELSGGETDLVALALRLALASVVAERHGSDSLGLLILDEVFGSQDASRREAILTALRELRSLYGQVLVISHVGGVEDAADKVVELRCGADRRLSEVSVL